MKIVDYLELCEPNELIEFLGKQLAELMIEFLPTSQPIYTSENLARMLFSLYGLKILDDASIRERLIRCFSMEDLHSFESILGVENMNLEASELIQKINQTPWKKNKVSKRILEILDIKEDIFEKNEATRDTVEVINSESTFYELLDYQFVIKQQILFQINNNENELTKVLVCMPTGTGKTKTAMHTLIHQFIFNMEKRGLIIWVAHTKELLEQAYDTFKNVWAHLGDGEVTAYKSWGDFNLPYQDSYNGFIFCGIQKLQAIYKKEKMFETLKRNCSILVIDEAHRAGAPQTKLVVDEIMQRPKGFNDRSLIGLTATPGRGDSVENKKYISMFENNKLDINLDLLNRLNLDMVQALNIQQDESIITYFQRRSILAKLIREELCYNGLTKEEISRLKIDLKSNGYKDYTDEFLSTVGRNKSRNQKIMSRLIELNEAQIPTIVFACSVEHGKLLSAALTLRGISNGHVFGDMNANERDLIIKRYKDKDDELNILINFEVLTTGFDAKNTKCVFITRPTKSTVLYSQMIGRGLRGPKMGGNSECLLVDIKDNLDKYSGEAEAFESFHKYWN